MSADRGTVGAARDESVWRLEALGEAMRSFAEATARPELLLETIARCTAEALSGYCGIALVSEDGRTLEPAATYDGDPERLEVLEQLASAAPLALDAGHPIARALTSTECTLMPEMSVESLRARFPRPEDFERVMALEIQSVLFVPMRAFAQTIGGFSIVRYGPDARPLEEGDIILAKSLADHAALAISNARLFARARTELEERTRMADRLRILSELSKEFAGATDDHAQLLSLIARRLGEVLGDGCSIRLLSADGQLLEIAGAVYDPEPARTTLLREAMAAEPQRSGEGVSGRVAASGQSILMPVITSAHLAALEPRYRAIVELLGIKSIIAVPLRSSHRVIGVVSLYRTREGEPYSTEDLHLVEDLAAHASLAIASSLVLEASKNELAERMQTEQVLRRGFLEAAPDAVLIVDSEGKIVIVNSQTETLFGYERTELTGQPIELLVPTRFRDKHPSHRSSYLSAAVTRPMGAGLNLFAVHKDGSEFAAEISLSPIETLEGTLVAATVRDVTERRREMEERNQRMQEANRLKSEFLANMSHELRTPLNAIIGFAALMHGGKAGPMADTHKEYLGDILNSSRHLLQLINDVLDLAKIESGRMELRVERVELERLVREVKDILRGLASEKQVQLTVDVGTGVPTVDVDPRMLKQVLYNYLSNAIKFTPSQGHVHLRITPEGDSHFRIDVEDTGIGIAHRDMHRLFVEFQQLDSGASKKYGGTGLGLALTKRIVEAHGGSVDVVSTPGKGSVFSAVLPRDARSAEP
jgi:PAS domain S-box-containing protein